MEDIKDSAHKGALVWEDNDFNFYTIISGKEIFIGKGRQVPYPLEEGDCWTLPGGETFEFKRGAVARIEPRDAEKRLKLCLEEIYSKFEESYLYSDPLGFVHKFEDPRDIEIAGFIASGFAFGSVAQIIKFLERIDGILNHRPYEFLLNYDAETGLRLFKGLYYRFIKEKDIAALFLTLSGIVKKYGSIEKFFMEGYKPSDLNLKNAISSFSKRAIELIDFTFVYGSVYPDEGSRVCFFFSSPEDNSPCKRINLFLRWMVRSSDNLDFGIWNGIEPYRLIMPVDTHIARISRYIGLTKYKNPSFKMAEEITLNLKKLDYSDPVKYDFAITRLGILDLCPRNRNIEKCEGCPIINICNLGDNK